MNDRIHADDHPLVTDSLVDQSPNMSKKVDNDNNLKEGIRYVLWGSVSVVADIGTFWIFNNAFHVNYQIANFIAMVVAVQVGYWICRILVFHHKSHHILREMAECYGTRAVTYLIEVVTLWIGVSLLKGNATITQIIGQAIAIIGNYIFSKLVIFNTRFNA
ncbi:GtrA family protein [Companilactobacillus ginsenosidimutans]|uniref:GtrA/DPMS transmembrane domain-containing protein n=1 Tax=Companilactobacillus ginsenosidimutans TaxID=1007676 RepID=A0A0H4QMM8_9LACO|nr:GtrA family protein [Companilactobacillus ginsenosidimutans]AKP67958.1 hypothetical protein ABM34_10735 [Companilactobacillus ginsenosidimutans]